MVLTGMAMSSGGAVATATDGTTTAWARSSSYGESVSCQRPMTPAEVCEVRGALVARGIKLDYSTDWRNVLIGIGYVLYILPGVVLYFALDGGDEVAEEATLAGIRVRDECMRSTSR
jgi:hypothetical protein